MRGGPERFCMRLERNRTGPTAAPSVGAGLELVRFRSVSIRPDSGFNCHEPTQALIRAKMWLTPPGGVAVRVRGALFGSWAQNSIKLFLAENEFVYRTE
jgi:hypothetical protein